jgi:hypothetical protein
MNMKNQIGALNIQRMHKGKLEVLVSIYSLQLYSIWAFRQDIHDH